MFPRRSAGAAPRLPALRPLALHLMLLGAAGSAAWAPAALAQTAATAPVARSYDIPPGPLSSVLTRFSREAGVFLIGAGNAVEGKTSPGLRGSYTPQEGFGALLTGTGLEAYRQSDDSYGLRNAAAVPAAPAAGAAGTSAMLPTVTITGEAPKEGLSEGTGSYQARYTNTATRFTLSPRETPQTITTVTRQQIDDAGMTSLDDALKSVSGVFAQEQGSAGATYYSRGFNLQTQIDGLSAPAGLDSGNRAPKYDSAFVDRIEVLQGAAGLLTGAGSPGGTVNLVRKRPTDAFQAQAEVQLGSWDARRFVGDVSSALVESGAVRGRLVAVDDRTDSFTDYIFRNRRGVYGIVEADLTPDTMLTTSVQYQQDESLNHYGVPFAGNGADAGLPRSSFWGDPNYRLNRDYTIYTVGLAQRLGAEWKLNATYSRQKTQNDINNFNALSGSLNPVTGTGLALGTRSRLNTSVMRADSADVYASGPFALAGRKHELVVGFNGSRYRDEAAGTGYVAGSIPINVHTFNPNLLGPVPDVGASRSESVTTSVGLYGVARWNLTDSLKLITGARNSYYEVDNKVTNRVTTKETGVVTPYAGLVYDIDSQYSAYASYSDIFRAQTQKSVDGDVLDPIVGANYEVGVKGELLDRRLNVAAALFRLNQSNLALRDDSIPVNPGNACGGTCYTASGKVVSQGIDLSANGQVGRNLNLAVGYTFVDAEFKAGPQEGQRYSPELPRHNLRVAASFRVPDTDWTVGGSVAATSKIYRSGGAGATAWTIREDALVLLGVHARYQISRNTQVLMSISNLTDKKYRSLYTANYSPYGEPRRFLVNLKHQF